MRHDTPTSWSRHSIRLCHVILFQDVDYAMIPTVIHSELPLTTAYRRSGDASNTVTTEDYIGEDQISHLIFKEKGRLSPAGLLTSHEQERAKFAGTLILEHLDVTMDDMASSNLGVDSIRDLLRLSDEDGDANRWEMCIHGTSALLKTYMVAVRRVSIHVLSSLTRVFRRPRS